MVMHARNVDNHDDILQSKERADSRQEGTLVPFGRFKATDAQ